MTPANATTNETTEELATMFEQAGLGPLSVYAVSLTGFPDDVCQIELEPSPTTGRRLQRFLELLHAVDAVAGKFHQADTALRLTLRGLTPSAAPVLVVGTFEDPAAVALIAELIERQDVGDLVDRLAALEPDLPN